MNTTDTALAIKRACQRPGWHVSTSAAPTHVSVGIVAVTPEGLSSTGVSIVFACHVDAARAACVVDAAIAALAR